MKKEYSKNIFKNIAIALALAIFFLADRVLKSLALKLDSGTLGGLDLDGTINIIPNIFAFSLTKNYFISFSLPFSGPILNIFIVFLIISLLSYIIFLIVKERKANQEIILLLFMFFGALSNLIDRLSLGFVVDYLELRYFTVFNLADAMIVISAFWLIFSSYKSNKKEFKKI